MLDYTKIIALNDQAIQAFVDDARVIARKQPEVFKISMDSVAEFHQDFAARANLADDQRMMLLANVIAIGLVKLIELATTEEG